MKKLFFVLTSALFCIALATPVYADVPTHGWLSSNDGWTYLLIGVAVLIVGVILRKLLKKQK